MNEQETYLQKTLKEIDRLKSNNRKILFKASEKISDSIALYVKDYFEKQHGYTIEMKKCMSCKNSWDIIIFF